MRHTSRRFGEFTYEEDQIITFPAGLLGFPEFKHYALKISQGTAPICWLLSVDEGGPELALIDPTQVDESYSLADVELDKEQLQKLRSDDPESLLRFAVVTLPENIKQMSMNLKTPIFIDPVSKRGLQYPLPGLEKRPVRCLIYRDLISTRPEDRQGMLVMLRKKNETIEIGDDVSIQILEFANGGVRVAVHAPKYVNIARGKGKVTPKCENKRADETMDPKRLEGIMNMHRIMQTGGTGLEETVADAAKEEQAVS